MCEAPPLHGNPPTSTSPHPHQKSSSPSMGPAEACPPASTIALLVQSISDATGELHPDSRSGRSSTAASSAMGAASTGGLAAVPAPAASFTTEPRGNACPLAPRSWLPAVSFWLCMLRAANKPRRAVSVRTQANGGQKQSPESGPGDVPVCAKRGGGNVWALQAVVALLGRLLRPPEVKPAAGASRHAAPKAERSGDAKCCLVIAIGTHTPALRAHEFACGTTTALPTPDTPGPAARWRDGRPGE